MKTARSEYPRPELTRGAASWQTLNGEWYFQSAPSAEGHDSCPPDESYNEKITVPFVPESRLSGIGRTDFMGWVSYRRTFTLDMEKLGTKRVLLHIGAADYESRVFVNGAFAGEHRGGYTPSEYNITTLCISGENKLNISVTDNTRSPLQPSGKQAASAAPRGCFYTRCTGIWQSVWLEFVPEAYIKSVKILPDLKNSAAHFTVTVQGEGSVSCEISFEGKKVCDAYAEITLGCASFTAVIPDAVLWDIGQGNLYEVRLTLGGDEVNTYFGMRSVEVRGREILLNSKPIFMRLVLDQGYYPDGIYTAGDCECFRRDIELSMKAGFNGARMHMKIFEPRFMYEADRMGYLLWGEYPNWGLDISRPEAMGAMLPEWTQALARDVNHPSIIGWCPFNESFPGENRQIFETVLALTKQLDPTRLTIDTSGYVHSKLGDIYDVHDYEQNPEEFARHYQGLCGKGEIYENGFGGASYDGKKPYFVSEFGGAFFDSDAVHENNAQESGGSWGYGEAPKSAAELKHRFEKLCGVLEENPGICGYCYTQLTDVEQEMNGIYTSERKAKF